MSGVEGLKPCPFCGGAGNVLHRDLDDESMASGFYLGLCDDCETEGPPKATHTEAVAAWNRRAAIEGGGGALQSSASVSTEQADGGVLVDIGQEVVRATEVRAFGLYDYSAYPEMEGGLKPHVVRDELTRGSQVVFQSDDAREARLEYVRLCHAFIGRRAVEIVRDATPHATPIDGGFGSSSPKSEDTHRVAETAVVGDRVWVVTASQGEYSDRSEWCVEAHTTEAAGQAAVERLDAEDRAKKVAEKRAWYCDDVTYYLSEVPLLAAPASDTPTRDEPEASEPKDAARRDEEAGQ